jgi:hypothetical protein
MSFFCPAAPSEASEHFNQDREVRAKNFWGWAAHADELDEVSLPTRYVVTRSLWEAHSSRVLVSVSRGNGL